MNLKDQLISWKEALEYKGEFGTDLLEKVLAEIGPHACSVCLGKPLDSGRDCICEGWGTESAEIRGLRRYSHDLASRLFDIEQTLKYVKQKLSLAEAILHNYKEAPCLTALLGEDPEDNGECECFGCVCRAYFRAKTYEQEMQAFEDEYNFRSR